MVAVRQAAAGNGRYDRPAEPQAGRRALLHHLAAEAETARRPAAGRGRGLAGRLDQRRGLDQAAEILLVQVPAGDRLDRALQFGERELGRHQLEHHRAVFQLGAQPRDRGREDAAVVEAHRLAERRDLAARDRGLAAVAARLLDQAGLVEQLVAVEHLLLVPRRAADAEAVPQPLAPAERPRRIVACRSSPIARAAARWSSRMSGRPPRQSSHGKEAVPRLEAGAGRAQRRGVAATCGSARDSRPRPRAGRCRRAARGGRGRRRCRAARHSRR